MCPAPSLSARRAWIEIFDVSLNYKEVFVALRKESVDRNLGCDYPFKLFKRSLSARRAWIEISVTRYRPTPKPVALRKESVDRNLLVGFGVCLVCGRSPQGERG